jgi:hypothetical protein
LDDVLPDHGSQRKDKGKQKAADDTMEMDVSPTPSKQTADEVSAAGVAELIAQDADYDLMASCMETKGRHTAVKARQESLAKSTRKHYQRYQAHYIVSSLSGDGKPSNIRQSITPLT